MINGTPLDSIMTGGNVGNNKSPTLLTAGTPAFQSRTVRREAPHCSVSAGRARARARACTSLNETVNEAVLGFYPRRQSQRSTPASESRAPERTRANSTESISPDVETWRDLPPSEPPVNEDMCLLAPLCMSPGNRWREGHVTVPERRRFTVQHRVRLREPLRRRPRCRPSSQQRWGAQRPPPPRAAGALP